MTIRLGIIGCGYWGPNLIRNFAKTKDCVVSAICDRDPGRIAKVAGFCPSAKQYHHAEEVFTNKSIDAVVIATPVSTHYPLASAALNSGKHVLVEKPMTGTVEESESLVDTALKNGLTLMVDHTFLYSGAVRKIEQMVKSGEIGDVYYYDSVRVNLGLFQQDVNVLWDLAPHDFSIIQYVFSDRAKSVSAVGSSPVSLNGWAPESIAYVTVEYDSGMVAHLHLNWLSPVKLRRTLIGGKKQMIVYDHLDADNQIKIYDKSVTVGSSEDVHKVLVQYRTGDMWAPKVDQTEPLELVCNDFVSTICSGRPPISNAVCGLEVVRLLQASQTSMESGGKPVRL